MAATRDDLFARFDKLGISHRTVDHPAVFTVEESREIKQEMPGGHSKNLFMKDKRGTVSLVVAESDTQVDLKILGKVLKSKQRLSFGKPELLEETLGIQPGSVTPFALINDVEKRVSHVVLDQAFFEFEQIWFHPLENTASTAIAPADLVKFIDACGHNPQLMDLGNLELPGE